MSDNVDLYLYEPSSASGLIQVWQNAPFSKGEYTAILEPRWWNDTTSANLQLSILDSGSPSWASTSPPGPVFKVSYPASDMYTTTKVNGQLQTSTVAAAATNSANAIFQNVQDETASHGISKGAVAAAVMIPLLALGVAAFFAVRFWRKREDVKRKRWSQALSSASNLEWEKGAMPGEKGPRPSAQFSTPGRPSSQFSAGRPMSQVRSMASSSVYAVENNMAGAGAVDNFPRPSFTQYRSQSVDNLSASGMSANAQNPARQSRISFAETTRGDRRSRLSVGDGLSRPQVGRPHQRTPSSATSGGGHTDEQEEINVSPSQMNGPNAFADAEMRRVAGGKRNGRKSVLYGSDKGRRHSMTSMVSADDFNSAATARGSVDELRDMEAVMMMRRSQMSNGSKVSPGPGFDQGRAMQDDRSHGQQPAAPNSYGPDQMMAVYAARGKGQSSNVSPPTTASSKSKGFFANFPAFNKNHQAAPAVSSIPTPSAPIPITPTSPPAPAPGDMRSYVHLHTGTATSSAVNALPLPGPPRSPMEGMGGMPVPAPYQGGSISDWSEDGTEMDIGAAQ